jgi:hypothetical protein
MRLLVLLASVLLTLESPPSTESPSHSPAVRTDPEACLPTSVMLPSDATGPAPASVAVSFTVDGEGSAQEVSVGVVAGAPASDLLVQAAARAVEECTWVLPGGRAPGPTARTVEFRLPVIPFQKLEGPVTSPKMADPDCFRGAFHFPVRWDEEVRVVIKFPVYADGNPGRVRAMNLVADPGVRRGLERAATAAVKGCAWIPGRDAAGAPTRIFVLMPLRLR